LCTAPRVAHPFHPVQPFTHASYAQDAEPFRLSAFLPIFTRRLSVKSNDLVRTIDIKDRTGRIIGQKEVVTYQGLLTKAHEEGLVRVATKLVQVPSDENGRTAIAKALVETTKGHFEALGDASPENVNSFIVPHLIRMAETRA
jgi:hypothetical protein